LITLTLVGFGLVVVFSASSILSKELYGSTTAIFMRQLISVLIGLALLFTAMHFDYHWLGRPLVIGGLVTLSILLLALVLFSPGIQDVRRWLVIGPARFQPSELSKLVLVVLTSFFLVRKGGLVERIDRSVLIYGSVVLTMVTLILLEPDFGTATSLVITSALLLFLGGFRFRYYIAAALAAIPLFYVLVYRVPYRRDRILAFLDPYADPFGSGYQVLQSLAAVGSGGLAGRGLAQGTQKLFFLPEPHTDFIYAVIGEETGFLGCIFILVLFVLLFLRGLRIALNADSLFGTYLGLGIISMITIQALINISVVLSLCPTKGIPLPFISVGGSSMLIMLLSVGILLNISSFSRAQIKKRDWVETSLLSAQRPAPAESWQEVGQRL
jgi:cell division protein FtsW